MKIVNYAISAVFFSLLVACGSGEPSDEPGGVIPEHQLQALEKAEGVEAMILEADEKRRKQMEESGI